MAPMSPAQPIPQQQVMVALTSVFYFVSQPVKVLQLEKNSSYTDSYSFVFV